MYTNKKIGIWGFGIVGQSVLQWIKQYTLHISIMDIKARPDDLNQSIHWTVQTPTSINDFFKNNDYVIISPGIVLNQYPTITQNFAHKIIQELDIFAAHNKNQTVAITGTVGKTTITSLLAQSTDHAIASGNIGNAMLNTLNNHHKHIILELSSYQLENNQSFAPDIAIWTNFYPNHLDHHANEQQYFAAKCNMLKFQTSNQIALVPADLFDRIIATTSIHAHIFLFSMTPKNTENPLFFIQDNQIILQQNQKKTIVFNHFNTLPPITYPQNWLIIIATWFLQNKTIDCMITSITKLKPEPHRLELIPTTDGICWYNDSKSTIWQATAQAINNFEHKKIALFLGGISKGVDRTPLFQAISNKKITVFAFGKEHHALHNMSQAYNLPSFAFTTLDEAMQYIQNIKHQFDIILFSPAGASFDLFKDFQDRGNQFKKMVNTLQGSHHFS